jgi:Reverse transcriptase (RNA-dependent DNA polymerase)
MMPEIDVINRCKVWEIVKQSEASNILPTRWVLCRKGDDQIRKARLVVRSDKQEEQTHFDETFAPTLSPDSLRIFVALTAGRRYVRRQLDVSTAFFNSQLDKTVYAELPSLAYSERFRRDHVALLNKSLYGLKQSLLLWANAITESLKNIQFVRCNHELCLYVQEEENKKSVYLAIYVDDIIVGCEARMQLNSVVSEILGLYKMRDLGRMSDIIGLEIEESEKRIYVHQTKNAKLLMEKYEIDKHQRPNTLVISNAELYKKRNNKETIDNKWYRGAIGSLLYLSLSTQPDISFCVGLLSRSMEEPTKLHKHAVGWIFACIKNSFDYGLFCFKANEKEKIRLQIYVDADCGGQEINKSSMGDASDCRSTSGLAITSNKLLVVYRSKRQLTVARSPTEAEMHALSKGHAVVKFLTLLAEDLGLEFEEIVM